MTLTQVETAVIFLLGAVVGSFLALCVHRLPEGVSVASPRSRCLRCNGPIRWCDNLPLLSYALLKGRCRSCGGGISPIDPLMEIATGLVFLAACYRFGLSLELLRALVLLSGLLTAAVIDWRHGLIPDGLSLLLALLGLGLSAPDGSSGLFAALSGGGIGGGSLLLLGLLGRWIYKQPSMGGGDIKLAAGMGLCLGSGGMLISLLAACVSAAGVGLGLRISGKLKPFDPIPFAPFLLIGAVVYLFVPALLP